MPSPELAGNFAFKEMVCICQNVFCNIIVVHVLVRQFYNRTTAAVTLKKRGKFNAILNDSSKIKQYVFPSKTFALKATRSEFVLKKFQTVVYFYFLWRIQQRDTKLEIFLSIFFETKKWIFSENIYLEHLYSETCIKNTLSLVSICA